MHVQKRDISASGIIIRELVSNGSAVQIAGRRWNPWHMKRDVRVKTWLRVGLTGKRVARTE